MKTPSVPATILGSMILGTTLAAQAACVIPDGFPPNDVSLDAFAFEAASSSPPDIALEVDMNGIQGGLEIRRPWATHGTLVLVLNEETGGAEWIASWTQNTFVDSVEWVCRLVFEDGSTVASGSGAVTSPIFFGGTRRFDECKLDLVSDCP